MRKCTINTCKKQSFSGLQQVVGHSWYSLQQQGPHTHALQPAAAAPQTGPQACWGRTGLLHVPASTTQRSVLLCMPMLLATSKVVIRMHTAKGPLHHSNCLVLSQQRTLRHCLGCAISRQPGIQTVRVKAPYKTKHAATKKVL